jgi:cytochrome c-type biogenesis protein CcmH
VLALGLAALAGGLYARLGAPGAPDQPLAARLAALAEARAARPTQAEVEAAAAAPAAAAAAAPDAPPEDLALVERLRATVAGRPDDVEGHRLLARSEAALGRWSAARAAQQRLVDLLGPDAATQDLVDLAEFMILAAGGYVSPEAEDRLAEVLARDPAHPVARYYSGLALLQAGRADLAFPIWARLLEEGPPDAPWVRPIAMRIDEVAALAGRPAPPLPDDAAAGLDAADRAAMIEGMVAGLADRLAADGGPPEDWARLIRSLGVLGRADEATAILREARETFAADPAARTLLDAAAAEAGLGG